MPAYQFSCAKCDAVKEVYLPMSEIASASVRCDQCKAKMQHDIVPSTGFIQGRTLGTIADKNSDKMSLDQKLSIVKEQYRHGQTLNHMGDKGQVPPDVLRNLGVKSLD